MTIQSLAMTSWQTLTRRWLSRPPKKVPGGHGTERPKYMRIGKFVRRMMNDDWKLVMTLPKPIEHVTPLPSLLRCGELVPHIEDELLALYNLCRKFKGRALDPVNYVKKGGWHNEL